MPIDPFPENVPFGAGECAPRKKNSGDPGSNGMAAEASGLSSQKLCTFDLSYSLVLVILMTQYFRSLNIAF
jgi:hypothetical protein